MEVTSAKYYNKVLIAKYNPLNKCFVKNGGILILNPKKIKNKKRGHVSHHFIYSLDKRIKAKYGSVEEVEPFTFHQFTENYIGGNANNETLEHNKLMLNSIQRLNNDTPVAATYSERIEPQRLELTVHRVIFYSASKISL